MDRRTLLYVGLCIAFLFAYIMWVHRMGWDRPRPGPAGPQAPVAAESTRAGGAPAAAPATPAGAVLTTAPPLQRAAPVLERAVVIETPLYVATFSTRGARLASVALKHYRSAAGAGGKPVHRPGRGQEVPADERVTLAGAPSFGIDLGSGPALRSMADVGFDVDDSTDATGAVRRLTFTARDSAGATYRETWRVRPDSYALDLEVAFQGQPAGPRVEDYSLTTRSWAPVTEANRRSDETLVRATSLVGTNYHRDGARDLARGRRNVWEGNVRWAAVQSRYFIGAAAVREAPARAARDAGEERPLPPAYVRALGRNERPVQNVAISSLVCALPGPGQPVHRFVVYFGPTDYRRLAPLGADLERAVDLGWAWLRPISHVLLLLLQWIERLVRNWGMAIVVLATLVRLVLHPLNVAQIRSMRAMQKIQPEVERLKQKYKNDAQAMNTAVMALYRENNVNPAGGCLPMVVQMPVFFALYAVLSNAIELRQAPFVGWIDDLSSPDLLFAVGGFPVRLLPLLMFGTGLLQQKMTPMSPQQAPSAYMMNAMMLVLFYNAVPSGLVLYWTVMNAFTVVQQWLVLRREPEPSAAEVIETPPPARRGKSGRGASARR
jgi:YidC/Oxa1 family membrane protein insertase